MDAMIKTKDGPDLFEGISLEVAAIEDCQRVLTAVLKDLQGACRSKQMIPAKLAADDITRTAGQMHTLAGHLSTVLIRHINRRVRQS